jgi:hypothetical protein
MAPTHVRAANLALQLVAIQRGFPDAEGRVQHGELVCAMPLQPTEASRTYTIRLAHRHGRQPKITISDPILQVHPEAPGLPHVYPGDELCLYYGGEWNDSQLLATTVVPWTAEWLLHYELWLATGEWLGGGTSHGAPA